MTRIRFVLLLALLGLFGKTGLAEDRLSTDVLVYGGTSGGVIAAYTVSMYGYNVILVEPGRHLGGVSSGGLGYTDVGDERTITGLARDFYSRVGRFYGEEERERMQKILEDAGRYNANYYKNGDEAWTFEPHVAELVFESYIDEAGIDVLYSRRVTEVIKQDNKITHIILEHAGKAGKDVWVAADMFIDASYEGDLMARSGVSYTFGREPNAKYGERYNGIQIHNVLGDYNNPVDKPDYPSGVSPYKIAGDPESGLLPEVQDVELPAEGTGDNKVQAYNFRMCLCQGDQISHPLDKPEGYDAGRYELLYRMMRNDPWQDLSKGLTINPLHNGKTDWNNRGTWGFSTDYLGGSHDYPEASYEERDSIWHEHVRYHKGLFWFLGHDERVPEHIREEMLSWGYCKDEFQDTNGWPHALYVREARRMQGMYVMTEANLFGKTTVNDAIAFGSYTADSHAVQRVVHEGELTNEGNFFIGGWILKPYPISYRAIIPKEEEATNLMVTFALSASHAAFGSIRMEPVFMVTSQSAGVAAAIALEQYKPVQQVNVRDIQIELINNPLGDDAVPRNEEYVFDPALGWGE